jgi:hypothetical protein
MIYDCVKKQAAKKKTKYLSVSGAFFNVHKIILFVTTQKTCYCCGTPPVKKWCMVCVCHFQSMTKSHCTLLSYPITSPIQSPKSSSSLSSITNLHCILFYCPIQSPTNHQIIIIVVLMVVSSLLSSWLLLSLW